MEHTEQQDKRTGRQQSGDWGERIAEDYLKRELKARVEARQWRHEHGELDLVLRCGRTLIFVEVRLRSGEPDPLATYFSIRKSKWRVLRKTAIAYLRQCGWRPEAVRFDVVGVRRRLDGSLQDIRHWPNVGVFGSRFRY
jgi:putative endonuclease